MFANTWAALEKANELELVQCHRARWCALITFTKWRTRSLIKAWRQLVIMRWSSPSVLLASLIEPSWGGDAVMRWLIVPHGHNQKSSKLTSSWSSSARSRLKSTKRETAIVASSCYSPPSVRLKSYKKDLFLNRKLVPLKFFGLEMLSWPTRLMFGEGRGWRSQTTSPRRLLVVRPDGEILLRRLGSSPSVIGANLFVCGFEVGRSELTSSSFMKTRCPDRNWRVRHRRNETQPSRDRHRRSETSCRRTRRRALSEQKQSFHVGSRKPPTFPLTKAVSWWKKQDALLFHIFFFFLRWK